MSDRPPGWSTLLALSMGAFVLWFLYSAAQFHLGWEKLDPLCVDGPSRSFAFEIDDLYTPEAAAQVREVIAYRFGDDAVDLNEDGTVFIRPMLFYHHFNDLVRLGQLVVRPEDEEFLIQTPKITCDELQPFIRSKIDEKNLTAHRWPITLYVWVVQPKADPQWRWEGL